MNNFSIYNDKTELEIIHEISSNNNENIKKICSTETQLFFLTSNNEVLLGKLDETTTKIKLKILKTKIIDIECFNQIIFIVTEDGLVFNTKIDDLKNWEEILIESSLICCHGFKKSRENEFIVRVNANFNGVLFTTANDELFGMGDFGDVLKSDVPKLIEGFRGLKILKISTGDYFVIVLTSKIENSDCDEDRLSETSESNDSNNSNECLKCFNRTNENSVKNYFSSMVWSFGSVNNDGQLGTGDQLKRSGINPILKLQGCCVVDISSGKNHSIALTLDGHCLMWGSNTNQQISDEKIESFSSIQHFNKSGEVLAAFCGEKKTIVFMNDLSIKFCQNENLFKFQIPKDDHKHNCPIILASGEFILYNKTSFTEIGKHLSSEQVFLNELLQNYNKEIKILLKKIEYLKNASFFLDVMFENFCLKYLNLIKIITRNVKSISDYFHKKITLENLIFLKNSDEMILNFKTYLETFCDFMCIQGFDILSNHFEKTNLFELFKKPFQHIWTYNVFITDLLKIDEKFTNYLEEKKIIWENFKIEIDLSIDLAKSTNKFWQNIGKNLLPELQAPKRRLILDSKETPIRVIHGATFTTPRILLFSDCLCYSTNTLQKYPLSTVWLETAPEKDRGIRIITPELNFTVIAPNKNDEIKWIEELDHWIRISLDVTDLDIKIDWRIAKYDFSLKNSLTPGSKYEGQWYKGYMHGIGILNYLDRTIYKGQFKNGQIHGFGRLASVKESYEGSFENGKYHGYGILETRNKEIFKGSFKIGKVQGHAIFESDRFTYIGEFSKSSKHGYGVLDDKLTGAKYFGMFSNNKKNGPGVFFSSNGNYFNGIFHDDILSGEGLMLFSNWSCFKGEVTLAGPNGRGTLYTSVSEEPLKVSFFL